MGSKLPSPYSSGISLISTPHVAAQALELVGILKAGRNTLIPLKFLMHVHTHMRAAYPLQEHEPPSQHVSTPLTIKSPQKSPESPWPQEHLRGNPSNPGPVLGVLNLILYLASRVL